MQHLLVLVVGPKNHLERLTVSKDQSLSFFEVCYLLVCIVVRLGLLFHFKRSKFELSKVDYIVFIIKTKAKVFRTQQVNEKCFI